MKPTERTPESYAIWLAESPREVDAWVAEVVMGWKWMSAGDDVPRLTDPRSIRAIGSLCEREGWRFAVSDARPACDVVSAVDAPAYTTDANAADLVRERVGLLERDFQVSWVYRVAVLSMQSGMMVDAMIHARPPHYVGAAWLLGDEVWRELRERGTITP